MTLHARILTAVLLVAPAFAGAEGLGLDLREEEESEAAVEETAEVVEEEAEVVEEAADEEVVDEEDALAEETEEAGEAIEGDAALGSVNDVTDSPEPEELTVPGAADEAPAAVAQVEPLAPKGPQVLLSLRGGGLLPFSELGAAPSITVGAGWVVPALEHRLAVVFDASYAQPGREQTLDDVRVGDGSYSYTLSEHDLGLFLGGQYHFADLRAQWVPYAALGLRAHMLRSDIDGEAAGQAFGENQETSTSVGGALRGGLGLRLGPGFAQAELELGFAGLDHLVTGDSNASRLGMTLGYTLVL